MLEWWLLESDIIIIVTNAASERDPTLEGHSGGVKIS